MRQVRLYVFFGVVAAFAAICWSAVATAETRVALVVGNAKYLNTPALANPGNDASDVAAALKEIGFTVSLQVDATKREFDQALAKFARDVRNADAAMFYYAGHGMQFQGKNFMMPVDAALEDEVSLRYEMTAVDDVKAALQESSGVKILVLDACRDNPLAEKMARSIRAGTRDAAKVQGFARSDRANGMVIVYATQADDVARDGGGRNSPFSQAFLKELKEPGLEVATLFRKVEADVYAATTGQQSPELTISMVPEYFLNRSETDQTVWARIRSVQDPGALKEFIRRFPDSFYVPDAEARLNLMERTSPGAGAPPAAAVSALPPVPAPSAIPSSPTPAVAEPAPLPAKPVVTAALPTPETSPDANRVVASSTLPRIQAELRRLGCYSGGDLDWDSQALKAGVAKYVRYANLAAAPAWPDAALLDDLTKRPANLCPPECSARETVVNGRCTLKTCAAGQFLSFAGYCIAKPVQHIPRAMTVDTGGERRAAPRPADTGERRAAPRPADTGGERRAALKSSTGGSAHCFVFNGSQYCE
jgi:hypothetical protein